MGLYHRTRRREGSLFGDPPGGIFARVGPLGILGPHGRHRVTRLAQASPHLSVSPTAAAQAKIDAFAAAPGGGAFKRIARGPVAAGLRSRLADPNLIKQGPSSLCGPSVLVRAVASTDPVAYVTYVISLYETGRAQLGDLRVAAGSDLLEYDPGTQLDPADWIAIASLRDSENWFFDYQDPSNMVGGITMPSAVEKWFKKVGFREVINDTNVLATKDEANLRRASDLWSKDYWVCLFVNADMLSDKIDEVRSRSLTPDHWIALTSAVTISGDKSSVSFTVYSWGKGHRPVPYTAGDVVSLGDLLHNYYGYVAARR